MLIKIFLYFLLSTIFDTFLKVHYILLRVVVIVIGAIVVSVVSLIKGNNNFSMVDVIKNYAKFEFMQKLYKYGYCKKLHEK